MRVFFIIHVLLLMSWSPALLAKETVFVPRAWMNVEELLEAVRAQTQSPHRVLVPDTMGKLVLYDNLTDAKGVREAVWEYYVYVLGQMVRWDQEGNEWLLRRHWDLELPTAMDLPALEEAWVEKKLELLEKKARLDEQASVMVSSENDFLPSLDKSSGLAVAIRLEPDDLPPWEDGWAGAPEMNEVHYSWWQRMLGVLGLLWETSDQEARAQFRRQWKLDLSMGRVPLVGFVMGGDVEFRMADQAPQPSASFTMSPEQSLVPILELAVREVPNEKEGVYGGVIPQPHSKKQMKGLHWPKKILSFSTKSWWQLLIEKRSVQKPEPSPEPLSPRVLERREQAERWFEAAKENHDVMREQSMSRRERGE